VDFQNNAAGYQEQIYENKKPVLTKWRSFASFLWSLMWKEKKSVQKQKIG